MTTEEKAKAYDEVREKIAIRFGSNVADEIFSQFEMSEDEKIRKCVKYAIDKLFLKEKIVCDVHKEDVIAWLEKQENKPQGKKALEAINEQKPNNKPKFNVGDWICNSACIVHIASIKNGMYYFDEGDSHDIAFVDNNYHLWTIQEAKDGDVLLFEGNYNSIVLFQGIGINGKGRINYHCKCDLGNYSFGVQGDKACLGSIEKDAEHYHPATQNLRDILFKKIHEAGYMWDSDSKQLLSLKAEPNNEKKPAWSEEDELNLTDTCAAIRKFYHRNNGAQDLIDWLKSLKGMVTWKPSDKQIRALRWVLNNIPYNTHKEEISGLLEQIQNI